VVVAVNSTDITVKDTAFNRNGRSVLFVNTNNSVIENVTVTGSMFGIMLEYSYNNTIRNNKVSNSSLQYGISLTISNNNVVYGNNVSRCGFNLKLVTSHYNKIIANTLTNSTDIYGLMLDRGCLHNLISDNVVQYNAWGGIGFDDQSNWNVVTQNLIRYNNSSTGGLELCDGSSHNLITENTFYQNSYGITSTSSDKPYILVSNTIYKNNFLNNKVQVATLAVPYNLNSTWDNGAEGNYWSDLIGIDANLDGIIDAAHNIDASNVDRYPLMDPWSPNRTYTLTIGGKTFFVNMISNSTVGGFSFDPTLPNPYIAFNVTGPASAKGSCNVTIPKLLLNVTTPDEWVVIIGGNLAVPLIQENATHTIFYLTYNLSTRYIRIIGTNVFLEFPIPAILLLVLFFATLSVAVLRRKKH
jgi:parallel beta-helix repeat protein